ncbi:MAG: 1-acyl-sn-glycerol-3-phosphate acyltransferase [Lachnospiraceae bacterium]|nr:1-acyl-sn-glycerol-3-phosphate acyltransferase [Lachnospiraceae bacterium]
MQKIKAFFLKIYCWLWKIVIVAGMRIVFRPKIRYMNKAALKEYRNKPAIFIVNHTTLYDGIVMFSVLNKYRANILIAKDWYEKKNFRTILEGNRCIPLDRNGLDTGWVRASKKAVKNGESVCIFPEGHRSKTDTLDTFKSGFTMLSQMTGAPIIPVYLSGEYSKFIGKRKQILFGEPMTMTPTENGMSADYLEKESERFRQHMLGMEVRSEQVFGKKKSVKAEQQYT